MLITGRYVIFIFIYFYYFSSNNSKEQSISFIQALKSPVFGALKSSWIIDHAFKKI